MALVTTDQGAQDQSDKSTPARLDGMQDDKESPTFTSSIGTPSTV